MKKLALFLAAVLLLSAALPVEALAAEEEVLDSGTFGSLEWLVTENVDGGHSLRIRGKGDMPDLREESGYWSAAPWWRWETTGSLDEVILETGITSIGNGVFSGRRIDVIPDTVKRIGDRAFYGFGAGDDGSIELTLPAGVESIGEKAFYGGGFASVRIPASVTEIGRAAFGGIDGLRIEVDAANPNYACVNGALVSRDGRTMYLASPETAQIPAGVERIESAVFGNCADDIALLRIPAEVNAVAQDAFFGAPAITSVEVDEGSVSFCVKDGALLSRDGERLLLISKGAVTGSEYAIPAGVRTVDPHAFDQVIGQVETLRIPASVEDLQGSLGETELRQIEVEQSNPSYTAEDGVLFSKDRTVLVQYPAKREGTEYTVPDGVKRIGADAFYSALLDTGKFEDPIIVRLPAGLTEIGDRAFLGSGIEEIELPDSLRFIGAEAFARCWSLREITIPEGVTEVRAGTFADCEGLTHVRLPHSLRTIGLWAFAFNNGDSAKSFVVPEGVTEIKDFAFSYALGMGYISLPRSLKSISASAFDWCYSLYAVYYAGSAAQWEKVRGSSDIAALDLGVFTDTAASKVLSESGKKGILAAGRYGALQWQLGEDGTLQISGKGKMPYLDSGWAGTPTPWIEWLESREEDMTIRKMVIGSGVTYVDSSVFDGCYELTDIYYAGSKAQWEKIVTEEGTVPDDIEIHCNTK